MNKTATEREAVEYETEDIIRKGEAGSWGLEPAEGNISQSTPYYTKRPTIRPRKSKWTPNLKTTVQDIHK